MEMGIKNKKLIIVGIDRLNKKFEYFKSNKNNQIL